MTWIDTALVGAYLVALLGIGWRKRGVVTDETAFLLTGRTLTLPAFVATLVSTWYGGILGVGEFGYRYGISQWVVFGLPYYVFALLFAWFLAGKIRERASVSVPDALESTYGTSAALVGAAGIALLVSPAPYVLMLASMVLYATGWSVPIGLPVVAVAAFTLAYVWNGGFRAVVETDRLQVVLMYAAFGLLVAFAWQQFGSPLRLWEVLPADKKAWDGGNGIGYVLVWFFIALWTFVDPSFHQRCAAAASPAVARKGILISVGLWGVFDFLTVAAALYGVAMLPALAEPAWVFPALAAEVLPPGLGGLFWVGLLATVMSTLDSFLFLSGQTLGRDLWARWRAEPATVAHTKGGMVVAATGAVALAVGIPDVIGLWYTLGSCVIPGLLPAVLGLYWPAVRPRGRHTAAAMAAAMAAAGLWMAGAQAATGIEPFYVGLAVAAAGWLISRATSSV